jgi:hypothetical protein
MRRTASEGREAILPSSLFRLGPETPPAFPYNPGVGSEPSPPEAPAVPRTGLSRRDVLLGALVLLLLAVALVRLAVPDRSRIRPLSIEAFQVTSDRLDPGQTITRETPWVAPDDIYVLGWNPWIGAPSGVSFDADLMLYQAESKTTIFVFGQRIQPPGTVDAWRSFGLPPGTGYRARKGLSLTFRYQIKNTGTGSFETNGATALVYFVPVEGN